MQPQEASFADLYAQVAPGLRAWAELRVRSRLRDLIDPEDMVQEVCCRAFRGFRSYDPERGCFRAWVFGIANTVLRQVLSELGRRPRTARPSALEDASRFLGELPDDATSITRRVARDEELRAFITHASGLPEEDRKLLVYRGIEGLTHEDVAASMGLSVEAAKKRWQRLLERLRERGALAALAEGAWEP